MKRVLSAIAAILLGALLALPADAWAVYAQGTPTYYYPPTVSGRRCVVITYQETGVTTTSNAVVALNWQHGDIISAKFTLVSGTGATLHPLFGRVTAFTASTADYIGAMTATAAFILEQGRMHFWAPSANRLYIRPAPNAGTDNVVDTELQICEVQP